MSIDRRKFLQLTGGAFASLAALKTDIAKALDIPAHNRTATINDVEHIVILMQENRPFDHHFGTLQGSVDSTIRGPQKFIFRSKAGRGANRFRCSYNRQGRRMKLMGLRFRRTLPIWVAQLMESMSSRHFV